jgi:hypothetical protein
MKLGLAKRNMKHIERGFLWLLPTTTAKATNNPRFKRLMWDGKAAKVAAYLA